MKLIFLVVIISWSCVGISQNCPEYPKLMKEGDIFFTQKQFRKALNKYNAAKLCMPSKSDDIDKKINSLFAAIEKEKDEAINQRITAENAKLKAEKAEKSAIDNARKVQTMQVTIDVQNTTIERLTQVNVGGKQIEVQNKNVSAFREVSIDSNKVNNTNLPSINSVVTNKKQNYVSKLGFYVTAKTVIDSLTAIAKKTNYKFTNTRDNEQPMAAVIDRLEKDFDNNIVAKFLYDSSKTLLDKSTDVAENYDLLVYTYLRSALYYSWRLTELREFDNAKKVLDEAEQFAESVKKRSPSYYYAYASLQNSFNNYYSQRGLERESYKYISKAVENMATAVKKNPNNSLYQRGLSVLVRNSTFVPDSLLSTDDRQLLAELGCQCANNVLTYFPASGVTLDAVSTCILDDATEKIAKNKYEDAILVLKRGNDKINAQIRYYPNKKNAFLQQARLLTKLSDLYIRNIKDTSLCLRYLDSSIANWSRVLVDETDPINNFRQFEVVYDAISEIIDMLNSAKLKKLYVEKLFANTATFSKAYMQQKSIQYVSAVSNANMGIILVAAKTKSDSLQALDYFTKSIVLLEQGNLLSNLTSYSENFAKFCKPYSECVKIYVSAGNDDLAGKVYQRMFSIFKPYYTKYSFDFYFIQHLKSASMVYGKYLYANKEFKRAVPVLEFASYEGDKASSETLANIYKEKEYTDTAELRIVTRRIKHQRDGMKKFTIPTLFGQIKAPFDVYVVDRDSSYPYRGIEDQVEWVRAARGGVIPVEVRESFLKLQALAWKNEVSFGELSVYALGAANEGKLLDKYKPLKDSIANSRTALGKEKYFARLYNLYEKDISSDTSSEKVIVKSAIDLYNKYSAFLIKANQEMKAQLIIKRVFELDDSNEGASKNLKRVEFEKNKSDASKFWASNKPSELKQYLEFYLEEYELKNASLLTEKILDLNGDVVTRDEISQVYSDITGYSNVEGLFLTDTGKIREYLIYFVKKGVSAMKSNVKKRNHYFTLVELENYFLKFNKLESVRKDLASNYNNLAWYSLLTSKFDDVFYYLNKAIELDVTTKMPYSNVPHAYLLSGQFEKAKDLYLKYKDLPFNKQAGFATFKDAFLSDFKDFEKEGLMNSNIREIIKLLNEK